jgi:hypothetical protein
MMNLRGYESPKYFGGGATLYWVAKGLAGGCRLADTCCRWCLVVMEVVVVAVGAAIEAAVAEALASEAPALASEWHL